MIQAIIFDKDGTLLQLGDTVTEPAIEIVEKVITRSGVSVDEAEAFRQKMGIVNGDLLMNSLIIAGSIEEQAEAIAELCQIPKDEAVEELESYYFDYVSQLDLKSQLMPDALEVVRQLSKDYTLGLVTNDHFSITTLTLERTGLAPYIKFVGCADQYPAKPDPAAINDFSKQYNIPIEDLVYVGDSYVDIQYGKQTGAAIGFDLGEGGQDYLSQADYVIKGLKELPSVLDDLNDKRV